MGVPDKDAWLCGSAGSVTVNSNDSVCNVDGLHFEDNFNATEYQRLPDSEKYLAILENKLQKLKSPAKSKEKEDLIGSVENVRNFYMKRLLTRHSKDNLNLNENLDWENPTDVNSLIFKLKYQLNPRQPLTVGEVLELLKYDVLSENSRNN